MNSQAEADPQGQREWDEQCEAAGNIAGLLKENKELRNALRESLDFAHWSACELGREDSLVASTHYKAAIELLEKGGAA